MTKPEIYKALKTAKNKAQRRLNGTSQGTIDAFNVMEETVIDILNKIKDCT